MLVFTLLQRGTKLVLATLLAVSALLTISIGTASAAVKTWDGSAGDGKFSTAANWSGDSVPIATDTLNFNTSALSASEVLQNDLTNFTVDGIASTGGGSYGYRITGNDLTTSGTLQMDGNLTVLTTLKLDGNATVSGTGSLGFSYGSDTGVFNVGSHTLTVTANVLSFPVFTGTGTVQADTGVFLPINPATTVSNVIVTSGAKLTFCGLNGAAFAGNLTVGGPGISGASISTVASCGSGGGGPAAFNSQASVKLTGTTTLTANTVVEGSGEMRVEGPLTGAYTLTLKDGAVGKLTIASSNNTSQTPNGTQESPKVTTEYKDNLPNQDISVTSNDIAVVTGTYGAVDVNGGVLKGTGTVRTANIDGTGTVAPGLSPGTLTVLETFTLGASATYEAEIASTTSYDQLRVGENFSGGGNAVTLQGTLKALAYEGFTMKAGDKFTIIDNRSSTAISGTFAGLAEGATLAFGTGGVLSVSYVGGDGNDVVLTVVTVPTAPDTGFAQTLASPLVIGAVTVMSALALLVLATRSKHAAITTRR